MFKKMVSRLTDNYNKDPTSNIGKVIKIISDQLEDLDETIKTTETWRDIDKAEGTTLDQIGTIVLQPRGLATDEVYRVLIKSKIARNLSTGDINTIINVLAVALDIDTSEVTISEMHSDPLDPEPAAIKIIQLPLKRINEAGMSPKQLAMIVQRTVAAGIRVGFIDLTGTFEFGDTLEFDNEKGFSDEEQELGGFFGYAYDPGGDEELPI